MLRSIVTACEQANMQITKFVNAYKLHEGPALGACCERVRQHTAECWYFIVLSLLGYFFQVLVHMSLSAT